MSNLEIASLVLLAPFCLTILSFGVYVVARNLKKEIQRDWETLRREWNKGAFEKMFITSMPLALIGFILLIIAMINTMSELST